jgi:hypothetical protein
MRVIACLTRYQAGVFYVECSDITVSFINDA